MKPIPNQRHHDGHGLNDGHTIWADERDPDAGNSSHCYKIEDADECTLATIQFQHGPLNDQRSIEGTTSEAMMAILLDRYEGFQAGPYRCRENALVITKLEEALHWMQHRANDRARRGVLGKNKE